MKALRALLAVPVAAVLMLFSTGSALAAEDISISKAEAILTGKVQWDSYKRFTITTSKLRDNKCDGKSVSWDIYISTYIDKYNWYGKDRANTGGCGSETTWGAFSGEDTRGCGIWKITVYVYAAGSQKGSQQFSNPYGGPNC
jgi:hypothetical protein